MNGKMKAAIYVGIVVDVIQVAEKKDCIQVTMISLSSISCNCKGFEETLQPIRYKINIQTE